MIGDIYLDDVKFVSYEGKCNKLGQEMHAWLHLHFVKFAAN